MKQFESIFVGTFETFINQHLICRNFPWIQIIEEQSVQERFPILSTASGDVLRYLIQKENPKSVLELGTGLGYSSLWILTALIGQIRLTSVDRNPTAIELAKKNIQRFYQNPEMFIPVCSGIMDFIKNKSLEEYQFILIDCDKIFYPELLNHFLKVIQFQGILLFDNVLWHGRIQNPEFNKPSDRAIREFWAIIHESGLNWHLFPSGDGLLYLKT